MSVNITLAWAGRVIATILVKNEADSFGWRLEMNTCCCSRPLSCCETCLNGSKMTTPWFHDMKIEYRVVDIEKEEKRERIKELQKMVDRWRK